MGPHKKKKILLIDSATAGCAGAYVHAIKNAINGTEIDVVVNHYYPYDYGRRIFFKYSELTAQTVYKLGRLRLYVRLIELFKAFAQIAISIAKEGHEVVCYALSSNLLVELLFLYTLKKLLHAKIVIICHDVVPFITRGENLERKMAVRRRFYELADRLIVHNQNSVADLREVFGIAPDKIEQFPFPIFDLDALGFKSANVPVSTNGTRFLFIGHLRSEKGIDLLLEAWSEFHVRWPDAELVIAGNIPRGETYNFGLIEKQNIRLLQGYQSDRSFVSLIMQADCVVLPYRRGTNSGILSTVFFARKALIVSDIPMFKSSPLIPESAFFRCGDKDSLVERLTYFSGLSANERLRLEEERAEKLIEYNKAFEVGVNETFGRALQQISG